MTGILAGIRVLDFGRYIAGPFCAALLADLGAEVIRVEKRSGSEDRFVAPVTATGEGATFLQMNRNKRSLTLDPMRPEGREVARRLVATADVVVANLPPQTLEAMGLSYDQLQAIKSDIILTTASAFGSGGPYSHRVGFDSVGQCMSGAVYLAGGGGADDEPRRANAPYVDCGTATACAFGTLAALMVRAKTGQGQKVEGSLLGTALAFNAPTLVEQAVAGVDRVPTGNRGQTSAPVDIFRTTDGWIIVQVVGQPLFERWVKLMGEAHWLSDPRFKDDISRGDNGALISERMAAWCRSRTSAGALAELDQARIPAGPVLTPQQALDDPHIQAMGFLKPFAYPGAPHPVPVVEAPVRLSATPTSIHTRSPQLGEHTDEILHGLGYDAADIDRLRRQGVI